MEDKKRTAVVVGDRVDLMRAAQVASIVDTKNTIPILSNMVVEASGVELAMTSTDLDIAVRVVVPAQCEGAPLNTTVEAKRIAALIGAADDGCQIRLEHAAGGREVEMKAVRWRFKLPVLPRDDMPLIAFEDGAQGFAIDAKLFGAALARTADAECDEMSRYYMCGTMVGTVDGRLVAVATNGHIMVEIDLMESPADWPACTLPSKLTTLLARLLKDGEGEVAVALDKGGTRIRFSWGAWTITSKLVDGNFPDWRRVIPAPRPDDRRVALDSGALRRAIARVSQMSGEKTRSVVLAISGDAVKVSCATAEIGEGEEDVPASSEIKDFRCRVNAAYLRDIAASASDDSVAFEFGEPNDPVRVEAQAGGGFVGVLMPMRL